jgi:hypothetical protein
MSGRSCAARRSRPTVTGRRKWISRCRRGAARSRHLRDQRASAQCVGYEARNVAARGRINWPTITVDGSASGYGGRATAKGTIVGREPVTA